MRKDLTDITIILDRSGSMSTIATDVIGGLNKFFADQRSLPGDLLVTLAQFDDMDPFEIIHNGKSVRDVPDLTSETYRPRGWTPLLDAIGRGIVTTGDRLLAMPEHSRPGKVLFVIMTDGMENSSKEYNRAKIKQMIEHQQAKYGWEFLFLGANQDAIAEAGNYGISDKSALTYGANQIGTQKLFSSVSRATRNYRTGTTTTAAFTDEDREAQVVAGVTA